MSPLAYKLSEDGKKIMWDGLAYESEGEADKKAEAYKAEGFEVYRFNGEGNYFVYTRRVSKETATA